MRSIAIRVTARSYPVRTQSGPECLIADASKGVLISEWRRNPPLSAARNGLDDDSCNCAGVFILLLCRNE